MDEPNGRLDWLRQDLAQLRAEMRQGFSDLKEDLKEEFEQRDIRLDEHSKRLDVLEKERYAGMKMGQKALLVISPLIAALAGYAVSFLPRR